MSNERSATEEFDHLCFEFGIELDEDVSQYLYCLIILLKIVIFKTTAEVEEAVKKGLPAERPVSPSPILRNPRLSRNSN